MQGGTVACVLAMSIAPFASAGEDAPKAPLAPAALSDTQKETFLLEGRIVKRKGSPGGITLSERVTLDRDGFRHDAHVQTIDEAKPLVQLRSGPELDFRDSYKNNVAAYRLDRLLGLRMVPVTVVRRYGLKPAAFTWWVDDVLMDLKKRSREKAQPPDPQRWSCQICVMHTFDQLIHNMDRNSGNLLIDKGWQVWMIDHTRAFKVFKELRSEDALGPRCERRLLAAMKQLDEPTLRTAMSGLLGSGQVEGLLARRDRIVAHFEAEIAKLGEGPILCDLPSPKATVESP